MKTIASIGLLFLLFNCCIVVRATGEGSAAPQDVTFCELVNASSSFVGKRIRVRAVYSYMFEVSALKPAKCCEAHSDNIWLDFAKNMDRQSVKLFRTFPQDMGAILGTFEGTFQLGNGHGKYRLVVDKIQNVERKKKVTRASDIPNWEPNCEK